LSAVLGGGAVLVIVGLVRSDSDLGWWFIAAGIAALCSSLVGLALSCLGPADDSSTTTVGKWVGGGAVAVSVVAALLILRSASDSGGGYASPIVVVLYGGPFVLGACAGLVVVGSLRRSGVINRGPTMLIGLALALFVVAMAALTLHQPFLTRFSLSEATMTGAAEQLASDPAGLSWTMSGDRSIVPGIEPAPEGLARFGSLEVGAVTFDPIDLDDCTQVGTHDGLRFWLGSSDTTSLLYCPSRVPEAGLIYSSVEHLDGPWYVEYRDE
jgi:hypothetical protein